MGAGDKMLSNITHLTFAKAGWHQAGDHVVAFAFSAPPASPWSRGLPPLPGPVGT
jgi:hypothetical protein